MENKQTNKDIIYKLAANEERQNSSSNPLLSIGTNSCLFQFPRNGIQIFVSTFHTAAEHFKQTTTTT